MIDPRTIKQGDSVKLRCGGVARIVKIDETMSAVFLWFTKRHNIAYNFDGLQCRDGSVEDSPFDIVEIIPRPLTEKERLARIAAIAKALPGFEGKDDVNESLEQISRLARGE